jgi:hypothetical protein
MGGDNVIYFLEEKLKRIKITEQWLEEDDDDTCVIVLEPANENWPRL